MKISLFSPPAPIAKLFSLPPQYLHGVFFVSFLNLALTDHARPQDSRRDREMRPLHGKHVCIRVKDAGIEFHFSITPSAFVVGKRIPRPDLTIGASAHDFMMLGLRKEYPDTLFFSRRLTMEGDTELGLFVKNTLKKLDIPPLDLFFRLPQGFASCSSKKLRSEVTCKK